MAKDGGRDGRRELDILRLMLSGARDALYAVELPEVRMTHATPAMHQRLGLGPDFLERGFDFRDYMAHVHPDDRERVQGIMARILQSRSDDELPENPARYRAGPPGGPWLRMEDHYRVLRAPDGTPTMLIGNSRDATEEADAREALRLSEERFRTLAENSQDIFFSMRVPQMRYEYISARVQDLHGIAPGAFYDDPGVFFSCVAPDWLETVQGWAAEMARGEVRREYAFEVLDKDGRRRWMEQRTVLVPAPDGDGMLVLGVAQDKTEERAAREALRQSEEHYRQLVEAWPEQVMLTVNLSAGRHEYVSPSMERVLGYAPQEFYDDPGLGLAVVAPHWLDEAHVWLDELRRGVVRPPFEFELVRKDGRTIWIHQVCSLRPRQPGQDIVVQFAFRDITAERQASEALRRSEERYRQLSESWHDQIVYRYRLPSMEFEYVSPSVERILGYTPEQYYGGAPAIQNAVLPEWRGRVGQWVGEIQQGMLRPEYEYEVHDAWGGRRWLKQHGTLLRGGDGEPVAVQFIVTDATAHKRLEEALRRSQTFLEHVIEQSPVSMWISDEHGTLIRTNRALRERLRIRDEEVVGRFNIFQDEQALAQGHMPAIRRVFEQGGSARFELAYDTAHTGGLDLAEHASCVLDFTISAVQGEDGRTTNLIIQHVDISEQKRAEEELRRKDALLSAMLRNLPFDFWARDMSLRSIMQSDESIRVWGDLSTSNEEHIHEETRAVWRETDRKVLERSPLVEERALRLPGGEVRIFQSVVGQIRDGDALLGLLGVNIDITERKATEEALRATNERYALLEENVEDVIWTLDAGIRWTYLTPSIEALTGYPLAEFMARPFEQSFTPESMPPVEQALRSWAEARPGTPEGDGTRVLEMALLRSGGGVVPIEVLARPLRDGAGAITGYCGTARDITQRKAAEEAMRLLNERYALLVANVADVIWSTDAELRWTFLTPSAEAMTGIPLERLMTMSFPEVFTPRSMQAVAQAMDQRRRAMGEGRSAVIHTLEMELIRADGELVPLEVIVRPLLNPDGSLAGYCGTSRDISQRKAAEEALQRSERRFSELIRNSTDTINILNAEGIQMFVSGATERMVGYAPEELMGIPVIETMIHPEDRETVQDAFAAAIRHGVGRVQYRHRHRDGSWVHLEAWGTNQLDNPDICGVVVNVRDITDRKLAEVAMQRSERLFRKLLDSMHEGVWAFDSSYRTIFANERLGAMLGYTLEELVRKAPWDITVPEQTALVHRTLAERRAGIAGTTEYTFLCKDGSRLLAQVTSSPLMDEQGRFEGQVCGVVDLTGRLRLEREVSRNQARLEALYELSRLTGATEAQIASFTLEQALALSGSEAGVLYFVGGDGLQLEPRASQGAGLSGPAPSFVVEGRNLWSQVAETGAPVIHNEGRLASSRLPEGHPELSRFLGVPALDGGRCAAVLGLTGKGEPYDEADVLQLTLLVDGMWRSVRARRDEESIRASLREKEALLREVHHRVKNNLQVVSSLLDMSGRRLSEPEARQAMAEVQAKVQAMSLIHILLYGSGDGRGIHLGEYVGALFRQLREVYGGAGLTLSARLHLGGLVLGLDQAVPLGLALNEALANVFKHATSGAEGQSVEVRAESGADGVVTLTVRDQGPGLPPDMAPETSTGLGMRLMRGLVVHQLGGALSIENAPEGGVVVTLRFRPTGEHAPVR